MSALACFGLMATAAVASETTVYTYDALGRLVAVTITGGPGNGRQTTTGFDPADNRTNYTVAGASAANFSIGDATIAEGGTATVTVTRVGSSTGAATVAYATSNGSATSPADYTAASGTLSFATGETSKTISIVTVDDSIYEGSKTLGVALSSPTGGVGIADANAVVTITDNEVVPQLAISNVTVTEGGAAVLTVTRSTVTGTSVSVNYATANGSAVAPGDYTTKTGSLTFAAGETSKTISVTTIEDSVYEGTESFTVGLSGATGGAIITTPVGTASIADNDTAPSFAISNASATEGGSVVLTVTKTGATARTLTVNHSTANVTAIAPGDYGAVAGVLTFLPADTSKTITVTTVNDTVYEGTETFSTYLSGASGGATISTAKGTGTITDNDAMPTLSVSNVTVTEGGIANVTVTKSGSTGVNATASYATANGTAGSAAYWAASGTLTLRPGETSKVVPIQTTQNNVFSTSKTFTLTLSAPSAATLGTATATVTILEDEAPPSFTTSSAVGQFEGTAVQFTVSMDPVVYYDMPLTINYTTSSGTATSGVDFTATSGTLTFNSPSLVQSVSVPTVQDTDVEADETITFTISSPSHGGTIATAQTTGTIRNDDIPPSQGPVANTDNAGTYARCDLFTINPITNDTDPGGNYPLTLVSVATGTGYSRTISGNNVTFDVFGAGTRNVQYVVQNTLGQQATGIINFTVTSGPVCS